jgi:peroxiredoxin
VELSGLEGNAALFKRLQTRILAISVDSVHAARAFAEKTGIRSFPLLGDLNKEVCRAYGVLRKEGFSERATFLIDRAGVVRYRALSDLQQERSIADYVLAIESLTEMEA